MRYAKAVKPNKMNSLRSCGRIANLSNRKHIVVLTIMSCPSVKGKGDTCAYMKEAAMESTTKATY